MNETVHVVDDDHAVRESLRALLESANYHVKTYPSAKAFLADEVSKCSCLITDIRMPEMDGLQLQEEIIRLGVVIPIVIMTGYGQISLAVHALKAGAIDFVEKPCDGEQMLGAVRRALLLAGHEQSRRENAKAAIDLIAALSPREHSVMELMVAGRSNKVSAIELGISPRTVEIHRSHVMDKMHARSLSDVVRISLRAGQIWPSTEGAARGAPSQLSTASRKLGFEEVGSAKTRQYA